MALRSTERPRVTIPSDSARSLRGTQPTAYHATTAPNSAMGSTPDSALYMSPTSIPTPIIHAFEDARTGTSTYLVVDPVTEEAAILDPLLDFNAWTREIKTSTFCSQ